MFNFVNDVPPIQGRAYINTDNLTELADSLLDNPGEWAQVPTTFFYPDLEGADAKKLVTKARALAGRIQKGDLPVLCDYPAEAKSRGTDVYVRINLTRRQLREMELD